MLMSGASVPPSCCRDRSLPMPLWCSPKSGDVAGASDRGVEIDVHVVGHDHLDPAGAALDVDGASVEVLGVGDLGQVDGDLTRAEVVLVLHGAAVSGDS